MGGIKKFFERARMRQNLQTRPGNPDAFGSRAVTGIDPGDPGSNVAPAGPARRPGRRNANTPLGPARQRL